MGTNGTTGDWLPQRIGKYQVECELGQGGFGRVFRAIDPDVNRPVAVKILALGGDSDLSARFRAEAKAAGNLHHKNIVTIYEYGEAEGVPYIAMEFLEGETLEDVIAKSDSVPLPTKMRIMAEVAEGLHYAHEHGVVHRDVKPANIVVLPGGGVKILDFGIARLVQRAAALETAPAEYLTGTLRYMSPEQFDGKEADARSDLFAYGTIYYELVTGKHPFDADDAPAIMYKIRSEEPEPLSVLAAERAEAIDRILRRSLAKEPENRYPSLEELRLDAEPVLLDLERRRAEALLAEAEDLIAADHLEDAKELVRQVLLLDASNRVARQMRMRIRQYEQEQTLRLKVNSLVRQGEERLRQERFEEAIKLFQSAVESDPDDEDLTVRLHRAETLRDRAYRIFTLKADARQAKERGELTLALKSAAAARQIAPTDEEAHDLLHEIQRAIEDRDFRKRQREKIDRAKGLLLLGELDAASAALGEIPAERPPELEEILEEIQGQKAERERRQRLKDELGAIRNLLGYFRFDEALPWLESLVTEWPDEDEPRKLQAYAKQEFERQQRALAIEDAKRHASKLLAQNDFAQAIPVLEEASKAFPEDAGLAQMLRSVAEQKAAADRESALKDALERIQSLRNQGSIEEAVRLTEDSLHELGRVPALEQLSQQLAQEFEIHQRRDAIRKVVENARDMIGRGRASAAISLLRRIAAENPSDDQVTALLDQARESWSAQQRQQALDKVCADVQVLVENAEYDRALKQLSDALEQFPGEDRLLKLQRSTETAKMDREREQAIQRGLRRCERFRQEGRLTEALELIDRLIADYGERTLLRATRTQLLLDIEKKKVAGEGQKEIEIALATAHELERQNNLPGALQVLELAALRYPDGLELVRAEEELRARIDASVRNKQVNRMKMEIEIYLRGRQFARAIEALDLAERDYPEDTAWAGLRARALNGK